MRIVAGRFGGRKLTSLGQGDAAAHLRPTADRVRESLFSHLTGGHYGDPISDATVLDLFAGTGALGLEALSRGASAVTFVDDGRKSLALLQKNIALLGVAEEVRVLRRNATRLPAAETPATLVFLDPPYGKKLGEAALASALAGGWLAPGALVVWEEGQDIVIPEGFTQLGQRRYGDTTVTVLEAPE